MDCIIPNKLLFIGSFSKIKKNKGLFYNFSRFLADIFISYINFIFVIKIFFIFFSD